MKKRTLSMWLCTLIVTRLILVSVFALEAEKYPYIAGKQITAATANDVRGDGTISYDPDKNILTLKDATIIAENTAYGIYAEEDLLIELVGENSVTSSGLSDQNICAAIYSQKGNVRIFAGENASNPALTAKASLNNSDKDYSSYGIYGKDIFIEDGVVINAESGISAFIGDFKSCGISGEKVSIKNASVKATAGSAYYSYGILGKNGIKIENSTVEAQSTSNASDIEDYFGDNDHLLHSGGIVASDEGDIHISGGTVKVQSKEAEIISADIASLRGGLIIDNKAVVQANFQDDGFLFKDNGNGVGTGLIAYGDIIINDASVYAKGREATISAGVYSSNGNVVINGEIEAIGNYSDAKSVSSGGSFGVFAANSITINGGKVDAKISMTEPILCSGLCAHGDVIINAGEVFSSGCYTPPVDGVEAAMSCGILSQAGDVVFAGDTAKVVANGGYAALSSAAVSAMDGDVKFLGGEVDLLGYIGYADNYIKCYSIMASRKPIMTNSRSSNKGNIIISGGNIRGLGNTGAVQLDGQFIVEPPANVILNIKENNELVGSFETWGLEWKDYPHAMQNFLQTQYEGAKEIDGSPFMKRTVIPNEIVSSWKSLFCSTQKTEPNIYTLTFETNGGSSIASLTAEDGSVINLSQYTTKKDGFSFKGWYADNLLTEEINFVTLDNNKTVYAGWTEDEVSIPSENIHSPPSTGDINNIVILIALLCISGGVLGTMYLRKKYSQIN